MRILVVGAGALGGYFGARMLEAGIDTTFLVRPRRAAQLAGEGLVVHSPHGDLRIDAPPSVQADALRSADPFDAVLLGCKAYDLDATLDDVAPAVGTGTAIVPMLNGMAHLRAIEARFGPGPVLGGQCFISATLDDAGHVRHLNATHALSFGEPDGARSPRVEALAQALAPARFDVRASGSILQEMWEKWVFIATAAGINCLLRGSIGELVAAGAGDAALALHAECAAVAARHGHAPREASLERDRRLLAAADSSLEASMLKDLERGARTEHAHILDDLLARAEGLDTPLLRLAAAHLRVYEQRRAARGGPR
ncbi:ketopantoate reductase family protein [Coralloluteibacterium stylophorae]|uniref:2-dehydropantoate 2-reductase n=1 Tax=Coralloluteibacterium stylophorae TaxID=1776034 RepID=A0AAP2G090_9GAMM|nr:ketopantoate reductase family protein [Coralloluteibacterium stylophorae]MBS7457545.1 ketopantoate reductase family protein [Coralloluteibacterium stylophorae]